MTTQKLPETLTLLKCSCESSVCDSYDIRELSHMDGAGYPQPVANELALRWNVHDALLEALREGIKLSRWLLAETPSTSEANALDDWQADVTVDLLDPAIAQAESHQPARQADGPPSSACRRSEPK